MENVSYIGLSQQMALHRLMEVTANNMANMNTPGFKSQNILFKEYLNKPQENGERISQVEDVGTYRDLAQGTLSQTANKLDFAIQGEGYFTIQTANGTKYTRDGSFRLNERREIVTQAGDQVMGDGGALVLPEGSVYISGVENGTISTEKGTVGKLKIVTFDNPQMVVPVGGNLYDGSKAREQAIDNPKVAQGMLENSNVQPILEMNKMIEILRLYQSAQNMLMTDHERQRGAIQRLTRV